MKGSSAAECEGQRGRHEGRGGVRRGRTVAHNHGCLLVDSLLCDSGAQVVGEEDSLVLRGGL